MLRRVLGRWARVVQGRLLRGCCTAIHVCSVCGRPKEKCNGDLETARQASVNRGRNPVLELFVPACMHRRHHSRYDLRIERCPRLSCRASDNSSRLAQLLKVQLHRQGLGPPAITIQGWPSCSNFQVEVQLPQCTARAWGLQGPRHLRLAGGLHRPSLGRRPFRSGPQRRLLSSFWGATFEN